MIDHSQENIRSQHGRMQKEPVSMAFSSSKNRLQKQDPVAQKNDSTFGSFVSSFVTAEDLAATGKALFNSALGLNDTACSTPGSTIRSGSEQEQQQKLRSALRRARSRSRSKLVKRHGLDVNEKHGVPGKQEQRDEATMFGLYRRYRAQT
jgi:hypothetical protein